MKNLSVKKRVENLTKKQISSLLNHRGSLSVFQKTCEDLDLTMEHTDYMKSKNLIPKEIKFNRW